MSDLRQQVQQLQTVANDVLFEDLIVLEEILEEELKVVRTLIAIKRLSMQQPKELVTDLDVRLKVVPAPKVKVDEVAARCARQKADIVSFLKANGPTDKIKVAAAVGITLRQLGSFVRHGREIFWSDQIVVGVRDESTRGS